MAAITSMDEFIEQLQYKFGANKSALSEDGYNSAAIASFQELGWSLPFSDDIKAFWALERATRHGLFIMAVEAAKDFQYKQIRLNQVFEQYMAIVKSMDATFEKAKEDMPELFGSPVPITDDFLRSWFTYIPNTRDYDTLGRLR